MNNKNECTHILHEQTKFKYMNYRNWLEVKIGCIFIYY